MNPIDEPDPDPIDPASIDGSIKSPHVLPKAVATPPPYASSGAFPFGLLTEFVPAPIPRGKPRPRSPKE